MAVKAIRIAEATKTAKVGKDGKETKGKYPNLVQIPYIRYPITFQKKFVSVLTLLNSSSKVNTIQPTLAWELGFSIRPTDIGA